MPVDADNPHLTALNIHVERPAGALALDAESDPVPPTPNKGQPPGLHLHQRMFGTSLPSSSPYFIYQIVESFANTYPSYEYTIFYAHFKLPFR